jgi:hypothetical protein
VSCAGTGAASTILTAREGLPGALVRALYQDRDGIIWIGTEGWGLVRLDPAEWPAGGDGVRVPLTVFRRGDGLFHDVMHQILEDDAGPRAVRRRLGRRGLAAERLLCAARRRHLPRGGERRRRRLERTARGPLAKGSAVEASPG